MTFNNSPKSLILLLCLLGTMTKSYAHGLTMTTAEIALRHDKHISMTLRTSLNGLFSRMQWQEKPVSLLHLANGNERVLSVFRQQLNKLFTTQMPVYSGQYSLDSQQARLPNIKHLRQQLQTEIATLVLNGNNKQSNLTHQHENGEQDRKNYLVVYIDGFLINNKQKELQVQFPVELGDILVSYIQPKVQTLTRGEKQTFYRQQLH